MKAEIKKQFLEEAKKKKERFVQEQNEMLERARKEMIMKEQSPPSFNYANFPQLSEDDIISQNVKQMAIQYAATQQSDSNFDDTLFLFRIILTPNNVLQERM